MIMFLKRTVKSGIIGVKIKNSFKLIVKSRQTD